MRPDLPVWIHLAYLVASVMFIMGLKFLSSPATARRGNQVAALGMILAVGVTLFIPGLHITPLMIAGVLLGAGVGIWSARVVGMTDMPQMVAILNGLGGGAAALVSIAEV